MGKYKEKAIVLGATGAILADKLWWAWPGHTAFALDGSPLSFIEHSHWGLLLTLLDSRGALKGVGLGAGMTLIASELTRENPFGMGKETFGASTGLNAVLLGLNLIARS